MDSTGRMVRFTYLAFFFVVEVIDISGHLKVNELTDGHTGINAHRLGAGYLQGPGVAEAYVALSCSGMNIYSESATLDFPPGRAHGHGSLYILLLHPDRSTPG